MRRSATSNPATDIVRGTTAKSPAATTPVHQPAARRPNANRTAIDTSIPMADTVRTAARFSPSTTWAPPKSSLANGGCPRLGSSPWWTSTHPACAYAASSSFQSDRSRFQKAEYTPTRPTPVSAATPKRGGAARVAVTPVGGSLGDLDVEADVEDRGGVGERPA